MTSPDDFLTDAGCAAYQAGLEAVNAADPLQLDAVERYALAADRAEYAREEWIRVGSPLTTLHSNGTEGIAPSLRVLRELERDAARYLLILRPRPRIGRPSLTAHLIGTRPPGSRTAEPPKVTRLEPPKLRLAPPKRERAS